MQKNADFIRNVDHLSSISEFKYKLISGSEFMFSWNGVSYGVFRDESRYCIAQADGSQEKWCKDVDEVLEYMVGDDRLRDVITQVLVTYRTL